MNATLVDTSAIVALLDRSEQHHDRCVEVLSELAGPLITCEAVIAEACYLVRAMAGAPETILENVAAGIFGIPLRLADHAAAVAKLLKKYRNVPMELADACLVDLADQTNTGRILTLDRDFSVYRWRSRRSFELLLMSD